MSVGFSRGFALGVLFSFAASSIRKRILAELPDRVDQGQLLSDLLRLKDIAQASVGPLQDVMALIMMIAQQLLTFLVAQSINWIFLGIVIRALVPNGWRSFKMKKNTLTYVLLFSSIILGGLAVVTLKRNAQPARSRRWPLRPRVALEDDQDEMAPLAEHLMDDAVSAAWETFKQSLSSLRAGPQGADVLSNNNNNNNADVASESNRWSADPIHCLFIQAFAFVPVAIIIEVIDGFSFVMGQQPILSEVVSWRAMQVYRVLCLLILLRACCEIQTLFNLAYAFRVIDQQPTRAMQVQAYLAIAKILDCHVVFSYCTTASLPFRRDLKVEGSGLTGSTSWRGIVSMAVSYPMQLLAIAPPTYVFWQAVALRLEGSQSHHWVPLLYLSLAASCKVVLSCLRNLMTPRSSVTASTTIAIHWQITAAELSLDLFTLSTFLMPLIYTLPGVSQSLIVSGMYGAKRLPLLPSWAATILVFPTLLAFHARFHELLAPIQNGLWLRRNFKADVQTGGLVEESNASLRGLYFHLDHGHFELRPVELNYDLPEPDELVDIGPDETMPEKLVRAACAPLPKELHAPIKWLLSATPTLCGIVDGLSHAVLADNQARSTPSTKQLKEAIAPLGAYVSQLLSKMLLSRSFRKHFARGLDKLLVRWRRFESQELMPGESEKQAAQRAADAKELAKQLPIKKGVEVLSAVCGRLSRKFGIVPISGISFRNELKPARAVMVSFDVISQNTRTDLSKREREQIERRVVKRATKALTDSSHQSAAAAAAAPALSLEIRRASCTAKRVGVIGVRGAKLQVKVLIAVVHEVHKDSDALELDRLLNKEEQVKVMRSLEEATSSAGTATAFLCGDDDAGQQLGLTLEVKPKVEVVDGKGKPLKLMDGTEFKVPTPLKLIQDEIDRVSGPAHAQARECGTLQDYISGTAPRDVFRFVLPNEKNNTVEILYAEDFSLDLLLDGVHDAQAPGKLETTLEWKDSDVGTSRFGTLLAHVELKQMHGGYACAKRIGKLGGAKDLTDRTAATKWQCIGCAPPNAPPNAQDSGHPQHEIPRRELDSGAHTYLVKRLKKLWQDGLPLEFEVNEEPQLRAGFAHGDGLKLGDFIAVPLDPPAACNKATILYFEPAAHAFKHFSGGELQMTARLNVELADVLDSPFNGEEAAHRASDSGDHHGAGLFWTLDWLEFTSLHNFELGEGIEEAFATNVVLKGGIVGLNLINATRTIAMGTKHIAKFVIWLLGFLKPFQSNQPILTQRQLSSELSSLFALHSWLCRERKAAAAMVRQREADAEHPAEGNEPQTKALKALDKALKGVWYMYSKPTVEGIDKALVECDRVGVAEDRVQSARRERDNLLARNTLDCLRDACKDGMIARTARTRADDIEKALEECRDALRGLYRQILPDEQARIKQAEDELQSARENAAREAAKKELQSALKDSARWQAATTHALEVGVSEEEIRAIRVPAVVQALAEATQKPSWFSSSTPPNLGQLTADLQVAREVSIDKGGHAELFVAAVSVWEKLVASEASREVIDRMIDDAVQIPGANRSGVGI